MLVKRNYVPMEKYACASDKAEYSLDCQVFQLKTSMRTDGFSYSNSGATIAVYADVLLLDNKSAPKENGILSLGVVRHFNLSVVLILSRLTFVKLRIFHGSHVTSLSIYLMRFQ